MLRLKRLCRQIIGLFPTPVPVGMSEFDSWVDSIIDTYSMPTLNRDSIVNVITATTMRLPPTGAFRPKAYFALIIQAAAAKQIAGAKFAELREKQKAAELAAMKQAEATAVNTEVSSNAAQKT